MTSRTALAACAVAVVGAMAFAQGRPQPPAGPASYLTDAQVQAIRRAELRSTDNAVGFRFLNDLKRRFVDSQQGLDLREFSAGTDLQQALYILQNTDDEDMINDLVIRNDPESMDQWRRNVQPIVLQGCASAGCHGGAEPVGGLLLYRNAGNENVAYTNFYALTNYEKSIEGDSMFGGGIERMINRQRPADSLLLQFSLPPDVAETPHPKVPGDKYTGVFRNVQDERYQGIGRWIEQTLAPLDAGGYGVDFVPAGQEATTPPTTQSDDGSRRGSGLPEPGNPANGANGANGTNGAEGQQPRQ